MPKCWPGDRRWNDREWPAEAIIVCSGKASDSWITLLGVRHCFASFVGGTPLLLLLSANAWDQWSRKRRIRRRIRAKELSKLVARFTPWVGSKRARFSMRAKAARGRLSGDGRKRALRHPMHDVNPNPSNVRTKVDRLTLYSHSP